MSKQVAETLEKARALMNSGGKHWTKGAFKSTKDGEPCYCAVGALLETARIDDPNSLELDSLGGACLNKLSAALPRTADRSFRSTADRVVCYNDATHRRWKHIDNLFKRAIKLALDADSTAV